MRWILPVTRMSDEVIIIVNELDQTTVTGQLRIGIYRPLRLSKPPGGGQVSKGRRAWQLVAQRQDRVHATTIAKNRLHAILHRHQFQKPDSSLPFSPKRHDFWLSLPASPVEKLAIELDLETIDQADAQCERLEAFMAKEALSDERVPFLVQLPGNSTIGALTILAAIGPIDRFPTAKDLVGYAGLGGGCTTPDRPTPAGKSPRLGGETCGR